MANSFRTQARETAKAKLGRLAGAQFLTNAVADRHLPPLLGEVGHQSENSGKSINRAFGGWIPGGVAKGRLDRARGGRVGKTKGKTTVNVIVGGGGAGAPPPMPAIPPPPPPPPPPPAAPPPGAGGGGGNPLMQALAMRGAAGGLGAPPGPPPMMRKHGGAVENAKAGGISHKYTGGADSGVGRLEKIRAYGKRAREK